MDGSNGKIIELLERIAKGQEEIRDELAGTNRRVDSLTARVDQGFSQVNGRLDNMIEFMGSAHGDHEQRIRALENEVFKKSG